MSEYDQIKEVDYAFALELLYQSSRFLSCLPTDNQLDAEFVVHSNYKTTGRKLLKKLVYILAESKR